VQTPVVEEKRPQRTIRMDKEADAYLKSLFPTCFGIGAFLSRLALEHKLRRELADRYAQLATKEEWEATGCNVD
jgi:hypothetical protein